LRQSIDGERINRLVALALPLALPLPLALAFTVAVRLTRFVVGVTRVWGVNHGFQLRHLILHVLERLGDIGMMTFRGFQICTHGLQLSDFFYCNIKILVLK
jgi:hypothetical protein